MAVCFQQGVELTRGDLDIFINNSAGNPTNVYSITFALYCVDPVTCVEVLIGPSGRTPVNPAVGEYYAAVQVPPSATVGTYRIRWTIQQTAASSAQTVVQEFCVTDGSGAAPATTLSQCKQDLLDKLRFMLRDKCVGGEEIVDLDVGGERMLVRMDDLYDILQDLLPSKG